MSPYTTTSKLRQVTDKTGLEQSTRLMPMFKQFPKTSPMKICKVQVKKAPQAMATVAQKNVTNVAQITKVPKTAPKKHRTSAKVVQKSAKPFDANNLFAHSAETIKSFNEINVIYGVNGAKEIVVFGGKHLPKKSGPNVRPWENMY